MLDCRDFAGAVQDLAAGELITVNDLAGRLDIDPRIARLMLLSAHDRRLVEPVDGMCRWQRTAL